MPQFTATSPLEVFDFSGGKTDYYLHADPSKYQEGDNFLILRHGATGKLFTRPGSELYDATAYQIPTGASRVSGIREFSDELYVLSGKRLYYIDGTYQTLSGPTGNDLFDTTATVNTIPSWDEWNGHLLVASDNFDRPQKIYKDSGGTRYLRTAGLPRIGPPTVVSGGGTKNYIYRFIFKYQYQSENLTFIDRGAYSEVRSTNILEPTGGTPHNITNIPVLTNTTGENWDTSTIVVEVYRTVDNGTTLYFVGQVTNGTTTFADTVPDATLQTNPLMYTEGGVPENNIPPKCKYLHVMDDRCFYAHIKEEGGDIVPQRVFQSVPGDVDSVPELNFVDVQDEIMGISSVRSSPIVLCKNVIYRLDGAYDGVGQGFIAPDKISDTAGCVSHSSIVQTIFGIFWAGLDGFYYTDGYRVFKVSDEIDETYQTVVKDTSRARRIQGVFDSKKLRIWWTTQLDDATGDNDSCFILDLNWGIKPSMPFTTSSGTTNFRPTWLEFIGEDLIRADTRGYVFRHKDTIFSDPRIDTTALPSTWGEATIIYNYVSVAHNFGTSSMRKFVPRMVIECSNETNLSLQITSINDDGRREDDLKPVRYRGNFTWGDVDVYWGDSTLLWGNQGIILQQRRFPARGLRCQYKQVKFTNATVAILSSDLIGTATTDNVAKTVTIDNTTYDWPTRSVDLSIAFETDGYTNEYVITARSPDVLTVDDPTGTMPLTAGTKWVIRGKPKNEIMQMISYSIDYMLFGRTAQLFRSGATGEVST